MVTDDWSPVHSIRLVLIFSQRRGQRGWLLPCFCVAGAGLCQPRWRWPHLPLGTAAASPRKELKSFSVPLQPAQEPAGLVGFFSGQERCFPVTTGPDVLRAAVDAAGAVNARRYPGRCFGLCLSCWPQMLLSYCFLSLLVGNLTLPLIQRERSELLSILPLFIMGFFFFLLDLVKLWSRGVGCYVGMGTVPECSLYQAKI